MSVLGGSRKVVKGLVQDLKLGNCENRERTSTVSKFWVTGVKKCAEHDGAIQKMISAHIGKISAIFRKIAEF